MKYDGFSYLKWLDKWLMFFFATMRHYHCRHIFSLYFFEFQSKAKAAKY